MASASSNPSSTRTTRDEPCAAIEVIGDRHRQQRAHADAPEQQRRGPGSRTFPTIADRGPSRSSAASLTPSTSGSDAVKYGRNASELVALEAQAERGVVADRDQNEIEQHLAHVPLEREVLEKRARTTTSAAP